MTLTKNTVRVVVALMVIALAGLIVLQLHLLLNTIELKQETFRRTVVTALNDAVDRMEEVEARNRMFVIASDSTTSNPHAAQNTKRVSVMAKTFTQSSSGVSTWMDRDSIRYLLERPQRVVVRAFNDFGKLDTVFVDELKSRGEHAVLLPTNRFASGITFIQVRTDSSTQTLRWEPGTVSLSVTVEEKAESRNKIAQRVFRSFLPPPSVLSLRSRIAPAILDSLVANALSRNGITQPFEYVVVNSRTGVSEFARPDSLKRSQIADGFSVSLFPHGLVPDPNTLWIQFPAYRQSMMIELLPPFASAIVLIAVIVGCFWFTVRVIIRQKEFAARLTDFINNMTHEFKTPISTITLASEGIANVRGTTARAKIRKFNSVIADENKRMKHQVDKILQMATLEEGRQEFHCVRLDAHTIIRNAAANIGLQVQSRGGTLKSELNAAVFEINADPVHFENVIHNVLENAVKYSGDAPPHLTIRTEVKNGSLVITIRDTGIGIAPEHLDKVFQKYYRVPTGNIHDVKGFGLGLSYVKLVVERHRGEVRLASERGKGTTVIMTFPLN